MDTGEETPLDSVKNLENSKEEVTEQDQFSDSGVREEVAEEREKKDESRSLQSLTTDPTCPSPSTSSSSVFATPSASMQVLTTASSTSVSPSSSVSESRAELTSLVPPPLHGFNASSPPKAPKASISPTPGAVPDRPCSPILTVNPSSRSEPFHPLPDIMTALNMRPVAGCGRHWGILPSTGSTSVKSSEEIVAKVDSLGPGSKDVLIDKFKRDPSGVLNLLQSALNMERLSGLLKQDHLEDAEVLPQLQNRLEAAFHTLRECQDSKVELGTKISETRQKIGEKRKHLEDLRGELKILGDEELKLKKQRDISHTKYSELKRRLQCSTEALQQIALITKSAHSNSSSSNSSTGSSQSAGTGTNSKAVDALNSGISA